MLGDWLAGIVYFGPLVLLITFVLMVKAKYSL